MDIKPKISEKFRKDQVSGMLKETMVRKFEGIKYDENKASKWTQELVDEVKLKLKGLNFPKYRYVVTAVVGEMKGEGVRIGARCLWDVETDGMVQENYLSDSLFCSVAAFAIYYY